MNNAFFLSSGRAESGVAPFQQNPTDFDPDDIESFSVSNIESDPAYADGG